mgnify:CR=1
MTARLGESFKRKPEIKWKTQAVVKSVLKNYSGPYSVRQNRVQWLDVSDSGAIKIRLEPVEGWDSAEKETVSEVLVLFSK